MPDYGVRWPLATLLLTVFFPMTSIQVVNFSNPAPWLPPATSADTKVATKEGVKKNKKDGGAKESNKQQTEQKEREAVTAEIQKTEDETQGKKEGEVTDTEENPKREGTATTKEPEQRTETEEEEKVTTAAPPEDST